MRGERDAGLEIKLDERRSVHDFGDEWRTRDVAGDGAAFAIDSDVAWPDPASECRPAARDDRIAATLRVFDDFDRPPAGSEIPALAGCGRVAEKFAGRRIGGGLNDEQTKS